MQVSFLSFKLGSYGICTFGASDFLPFYKSVNREALSRFAKFELGAFVCMSMVTFDT